MKKIILKNIKISDKVTFSYKQVLIDMVISYVNNGVSLKEIEILLPFMQNLNAQDEIVLVTDAQYNLLNSIIQNFTGWKFLHQCIIDFSNDIAQAEYFKSAN